MAYEKEFTLSEYKKIKLKVLKQLGVRITNAETKHLLSLENEIQVDNYAKTLIFDIRYKNKYATDRSGCLK